MIPLFLIFIYAAEAYTQFFSSSELMIKSNLNIKSICKKIHSEKPNVLYYENVTHTVQEKQYTINITSFEERLIKHSLFEYWLQDTSKRLDKSYVEILYSDKDGGKIVQNGITVQFADQNIQRDSRVVSYRGPVWFLKLHGKSLEKQDWNYVVDLFFKDLRGLLPSSMLPKLVQMQEMYTNMHNDMRVRIDDNAKKVYLQKGGDDTDPVPTDPHYLSDLKKQNGVWYYDSNAQEWKHHTPIWPLHILQSELAGNYNGVKVLQVEQDALNAGKLKILLSTNDREYYRRIMRAEQPPETVNDDWSEWRDVVQQLQCFGVCSGWITETGNMFGVQMHSTRRQDDLYLAQKSHSYGISLNSVYPNLYVGMFAGKDFPAMQVYAHHGFELHTLKMQYITGNCKIEFPNKMHLCSVIGFGCCFKLSACVSLFTDVLYSRSISSLVRNVNCCDSRYDTNIDSVSFDKLVSIIGLKYVLP